MTLPEVPGIIKPGMRAYTVRLLTKPGLQTVALPQNTMMLSIAAGPDGNTTMRYQADMTAIKVTYTFFFQRQGEAIEDAPTFWYFDVVEAGGVVYDVWVER
jgi:hypothetical protein